MDESQDRGHLEWKVDETNVPGAGLSGVVVVGAFIALFLRFGGIVVIPVLRNKQPVSPDAEERFQVRRQSRGTWNTAEYLRVPTVYCSLLDNASTQSFGEAQGL
jgi:hypothetical protein